MMEFGQQRALGAEAGVHLLVQVGILQRDRCLGGNQLQHRAPGRSEGPGGQVVLEIEHADEPGLGDQGQAENGPHLVLTEVGICGKRGLGGGIVENDALAGAHDIVEHRLRQHGRGH